MSKLVLEKLQAKLGSAVLETHSHFGDDTAVVAPDVWRAAAQMLRDDPALDFDLFVDLCAVDFPDREPRFELVLHLYSVGKRHRIRLKTRVGDAEGDHAEVESLVPVWSGANWFERETFDMMGIVFRGHPDLRRILMYPEFEGHPLRKDYPANRTQPLVPYRTEEEAGMVLDKIAPFSTDEGMSFGRKWFETPKS
ncbi:MAG TPA: NADH-quinone oxidoreductase subunit C [Polyangiaceae bacterium]|nr:NADH-quinone oxidoreductase subunit C [Polyangiaceae bacterium]